MNKKLSRRVVYIYIAALLLSLHYAFTVYINSNFLSQFFSEQKLSLLYTFGSCITLLIFICTPNLIRKFGTWRLLLSGIVLEIIALGGLFWSTSLTGLTIFFLMLQALPTLLLFGLDVFLEDTLKTEKVTGKVRSMYLTASNLAFVISPFIVSQIISFSSYRYVYLIAAVFCFVLFFIVGDKLQPIQTKSLEQVSFFDSLRKITKRRSLRIVIYLDFLLQSFYALMVVYMSLYLHHIIGFNWTQIGLIFTIMLVPFVIFEAPLGRIFDHAQVEIDTITVGFFIMSVSLIAMSFIHSQNFVLWASLLFLSRIGASFAEVGNEYSFFKRVTGRDAGFISLFRMTVPLAYAIVPLIAEVLLSYVPLQTLFLCGGVALLTGVFYATLLRAYPRS